MSTGRFGQKAAPEDPTKVPNGIDSQTLFSPSIPDEIKAAVPLLHQFSIEIIRSCIKKLNQMMALGFTINADEFIGFQTELGQQGEEFGVVFTGLYSMLRFAIGSKSSLPTINQDLRSMNVPPQVVDDICRVIQQSRATIETRILAKKPGFPSLSKLRWRIDVTISSGSLSRVMRPSILMQMILSDGVIKTFDLPIEQFNQLRYGVAKMLHDMQILDRHPIMKIIKEFDKRDDEEKSRK